jgi:hypothetical protein
MEIWNWKATREKCRGQLLQVLHIIAEEFDQAARLQSSGMLDTGFLVSCDKQGTAQNRCQPLISRILRCGSVHTLDRAMSFFIQQSRESRGMQMPVQAGPVINR